MWYAASEIVFFLVLAAVIGGLIGYGIAQIYQIDFAALRAARADTKDRGAELAAAYEEVADLRRKLQITTEALRGADAPTPHLDPPIIDPLAADDHDDSSDGFFPPSPDIDADIDIDIDAGDANTSGRRLSERVADAERS